MQSTVLLLGLFAGTISAVPLDQQPLAGASRAVGAETHDETPVPLIGTSSPGLRGRFLHITDFHPDGFYKAGTLTGEEDGSCHHGHGDAGYFGQEGSDCDSPLALVNETFRWIEANLKDEIDFVIWTGDSARHDNDERIPRTTDEIVQLNAYMAQQWTNLFGTRDKVPSNVPRVTVPVVPTFGNNDIAPHNIFRSGPNPWTKRFTEVWHDFIPENQRHSFVEGGWFTSEVIPGKLAVVSLNTMYFFDSNSAVDGCADASEPGYEHMEWLRVQLQLLRERNMKAILMGHVAPARSEEKTNWDETCWQKYTLWIDRYRDVVVSGLYGHMNVDHFILQDSHDVDLLAQPKAADGVVSIQSKADYLTSLRKQWADLPSPPSGVFDDASVAERSESSELDENKKGKKDKKRDKKKKKEKKRRKFLKKIGGPWAERYSVSMVSPSLVPNYFPTLRVIEYNITGVEDAGVANVPAVTPDVDSTSLIGAEALAWKAPNPPHDRQTRSTKSDFVVPRPPSPASPPGPAYSNQALSLLGYTQYFANLTRINAEVASSGGKGGHFNFEVEYRTGDEVYQMEDLTVRSFFQLAARIGEDGNLSASKKKKVNSAWRAFVERAFAGFVDVDDLDEEDGRLGV
ncbi:uncharacterized protein N7459_006960 [Penicillium hispanicum]|uniref:uncharacterized protein n=1 Tax=Penicillium hispanicum TaxID=1080232 RepID=UPI00253FF481|nr:uncharacterized protein N7459_006960 [Penicillium hispanicum]KAJ5577996.1 hypothetical protein N7459_006960 [Penicillium hispanicum]